MTVSATFMAGRYRGEGPDHVAYRHPCAGAGAGRGGAVGHGREPAPGQRGRARAPTVPSPCGWATSTLPSTAAPPTSRCRRRPWSSWAWRSLPRSWPWCARATTASRRTSRASGRSSRRPASTRASCRTPRPTRSTSRPPRRSSAPAVTAPPSCRTARASTRACSSPAPSTAGRWTRYLDVDHPLQRHITTVVARLGGEAVTHVGVDGCGAPAHTLSLTGLARAFAAVAVAPTGTPMASVRAAMTSHPDMVGGTGRDVTALMEGVPGWWRRTAPKASWPRPCPTGGRSRSSWPTDPGGRSRPSPWPRWIAWVRTPPAPTALRRTPVLGGGRPVGEAHAVPF